LNLIKACLDWLKRAWTWLRWAVALGIMGYLFLLYRDQFYELAQREIDYAFLAIAFVLSSTAIILTFIRWFLLVKGQELPFRINDAIRLGFIGYLFNYVAPGAAGGDIVKAVMIAKQQASRRAAAAATVLLDRLFGMLALFMVGALASLFHRDLWAHPEIMIMVMVLWGGSLGGLVGLALSMHPKILMWSWVQRLTQIKFVGPPLADILDGMMLYQARPRVLVGALTISIFGHFGMLSSFYFCSLALQSGLAAPDYWTHLMLIPGAEVASVFVPVPGGVGALEAAVIYVYHVVNEANGMLVDMPSAEVAGLATALGYRAIAIVIAVIGAAYYMTSKSELEVLIEQKEEGVG
jgi:glycosyltransferase 2 family protein